MKITPNDSWVVPRKLSLIRTQKNCPQSSKVGSEFVSHVAPVAKKPVKTETLKPPIPFPLNRPSSAKSLSRHCYKTTMNSIWAMSSPVWTTELASTDQKGRKILGRKNQTRTCTISSRDFVSNVTNQTSGKSQNLGRNQTSGAANREKSSADYTLPSERKTVSSP
jgi:hypothetical protein